MKTQTLEVHQTVNDQGQLIREEYWQGDKLHNEHGPAIREWNDQGQLIRETYYQHGTEVDRLSCEGKVVEVDGRKYQWVQFFDILR